MKPTSRMSSHDTVFLHWERPEQPMHVGEALVYSGTLTADALVKKIEARMSLLPRYRQRIVRTPFGIAHPVWEDDPTFDVRNHVTEEWLPEGSDDRALGKRLGELFCQLIDRDRPVWHMTVLHGHQSGDTIVFLKLHHSMVDGVSSVEIIEVLHSAAPDIPLQVRPSVEPRSDAALLRDGVLHNLGRVVDVTRAYVDVLRKHDVAGLRQRGTTLVQTLADTLPMMVLPAPRTPYNARIHAAREIAWVDLPLDEVHQVRRALGATVNDVVLDVLSGALRRGMVREGYRTKDVQLRTMVPWSVRTTGAQEAPGNAVSMIVAPLHVDEADPRRRLELQQKAIAELKAKNQAEGYHEIIKAGDLVPAPLYSLIWKLWPLRYFPFNIVSSNVRGPAEPLFLDDHELLHWYPVGVNWTTNALFLVTISYRGRLTLGLASDPTVVPDLWAVADDFRAAYDEVRAAALDS